MISFKNKNKPIFCFWCIFLLGVMFYIPKISAEINDYAPIKQGNCALLQQTCASCSYVSISVVFKNITMLDNEPMTQSGSLWTYQFCNTSSIGRYDVSGHGDLQGIDTGFNVLYFEVTPSGFLNTTNFYLFAGLIIAGIIILGFSAKEEWYIVIGGMMSIMLGIYTINYGFIGFKDMFMTWGIGLFEISIGSILSLKAGLSKIEE